MPVRVRPLVPLTRKCGRARFIAPVLKTDVSKGTVSSNLTASAKIEKNMYKVYWTYGDQTHGQEFEDMTEALKYCQYLRRTGQKFVTMCSELADMVGEFGVAEVGPGYDWKKRRI